MIFMVDVCVCAYGFMVQAHFLLVKLFPVHVMEPEVSCFMEFPLECHDFQLWQQDEDGDGGKQRGGLGKGWDAPNTGLISDLLPPPHPRQSRAIDSSFVRCVPFSC